MQPNFRFYSLFTKDIKIIYKIVFSWSYILRLKDNVVVLFKRNIRFCNIIHFYLQYEEESLQNGYYVGAAKVDITGPIVEVNMVNMVIKTNYKLKLIKLIE